MKCLVDLPRKQIMRPSHASLVERLLQMRWLIVLKVAVLAAMVLISGFHFFWMLVPRSQLMRSSEVPRNRRPRSMLPSSSSIDRNLTRLHRAVETCLRDNGDGIKVIDAQNCNIRIRYPKDTANSWVYRKPSAGAQVQEASNLTWDYNLCSLRKFWEKARKRPAVVTKEILDCYLKEESPKRLLATCKVTKDCYHRVRKYLPQDQPFAPGQAGRCALVGNAASLKSNATFGNEIDAHDTVIRLNDAKIGSKYLKWAGQKTTFRFVNERVTKALLPLIRKIRIRNETLILRRALGGTTLKRLQQEGSTRNPVYVSPMSPVGSGLPEDTLLGFSSGFLALNFAISICESVDMYGFSIDPGPQPSWPRYFSGPKFGHTPLTYRAYFLLLECLRVVSLKSSVRILNGRESTLPAAEVLRYSNIATRSSDDINNPGEEAIDRCHRSSASDT